MKKELEREVMNTLYREKILSHRRYLRFYEIAKESDIPKSSLQRILPRLIKRGWIEKKNAGSWSGKEPEGRMYHLEVLRKNIDSPEKQRFHVREITKEYMEGLEKLPDFVDKTHGLHPNYKIKILRKGRLKDRVASLEKILTNHTPKNYDFYRIVEYPFLFKVTVTIGSDPKKEAYEYTFEKGRKRFWKNAANEVAKEVKDILRERNMPVFCNLY